METFRFRHFKVYQDAKRLNVKIFQVTKNIPPEIRSQILRSSLSVPLNIAEGSAKKSDKDINRYLENALGSINEVVATLDVAKDLSLLDLDDFEMLKENCEEVAKQLGGFSKRLKS